MSELTTLKSAAEVKAVADEAIRIQERQSVAHAINEAANSGEHVVLWMHPISDELKTTLESQGYKISTKLHCANPKFLYRIEGF